jgi:hypothetical protein
MAKRRRQSTIPPTFVWAVAHPVEGLEIADYVPVLYRTHTDATRAAKAWPTAVAVPAVVMILPTLPRSK